MFFNLLGIIIPSDEYFSKGLKPPTSTYTWILASLPCSSLQNCGRTYRRWCIWTWSSGRAAPTSNVSQHGPFGWRGWDSKAFRNSQRSGQDQPTTWCTSHPFSGKGTETTTIDLCDLEVIYGDLISSILGHFWGQFFGCGKLVQGPSIATQTRSSRVLWRFDRRRISLNRGSIGIKNHWHMVFEWLRWLRTREWHYLINSFIFIGDYDDPYGEHWRTINQLVSWDGFGWFAYPYDSRSRRTKSKVFSPLQVGCEDQ